MRISRPAVAGAQKRGNKESRKAGIRFSCLPPFLIRSLLLFFVAPLFAQNPEPYPSASSKKGLQVQMIDDALALGVKHAALNCPVAPLIDPQPLPDSILWKCEGRDYAFRPAAVAALDQRVKPLSDAGVIVSLIVLNYAPTDPARAAILLHPRYDPAAPNKMSAFNTGTPEGARWFGAIMDFLAARYSDPAAPHGRVWNYIIGNEVNSHWWWNNMGHATADEVARDYEHTVRLAHDSVRRHSANARVFLSLEHYWSGHYGPRDDQACAGRTFLESFAREARAHGDFDWHLAYHPYPEDLTECRFWLDPHATPDDDAKVISFKNLEVLTRYFERPELLFQGHPRHIILSEQGFHCNEKRPDGERDQAAAFAYAWVKVARLPGIDAFILHRHTDHALEGLNLGLWTHRPGAIADPDRKRMMYEVFRAADTPEWESAFAFALPVVGLKAW
jgi:hypothetical protein